MRLCVARHYPIVLSTVTYAPPPQTGLSSPDPTHPTLLSSEVPIHSFSGITQYRSLQSGARSRDHSIHLPSSYDATKAYPRSCWASTARAAYPSGVGGHMAGANYSEAIVPEDLQFVSTRSARGGFDTRQRDSEVRSANYTTPSLSIGGGFVNTIVCAPVSGNFAGSGSFYTDNDGRAAVARPARNPAARDGGHGGRDTDCVRPSFRLLPLSAYSPPLLLPFARAKPLGHAQRLHGGNTTKTIFSGDMHHSGRARAR
ncbi:hypothetical protein B0H14DRAFT_3439387 [Mycena olivaceomarginata]|nr:hypothetical protein B0H14DRAFT_3439387 [Mycena olivaceomarginata]